LIAAAAIAAWGVLGAIFLPGYFRGRLERLVSENTRGSLSIGRLGVNPSCCGGDPRLRAARPERDTLLSAKEFTLDVSITSIARRGIVLDRIALVAPRSISPSSPTADWTGCG
jgi:hypothetical protein